MENLLGILETRLFDQLRHFFQQRDFTEYKSLKQFRRYTPSGFQNVMLSVNGEGPFGLNVHLGIRSDLVERLAFQFMSTSQHFAMQATTVSIPMQEIDRSVPKRLMFDSEEEVSSVAEFIMGVFTETAFPFFKDHSSIQTLDNLLNEEPDRVSPYLHNQTYRCFRGLIVAKMAHNLEFGVLVDTYHAQLKRRVVPASLIKQFERLAVHLSNFSMN